jgi:protein-S-isoprenylcysteine O-methyltransferase Ste14
MMAESETLLLLAVGWIVYFALHSLAASLQAKRFVARRWPQLMRVYRLVFNLQALVLAVPLLWLTFTAEGDPIIRYTGVWAWAADLAAAGAALLFLWSLRYYDGSEFLGLWQWRQDVRAVADQERFQISPLHRFVRHPWYALALVIIWSRDMNAALLVTTAAVTIYFVVGSRLEERKLIAYHGDVYRRYRARVPALVPLPWRFLSRGEARALVRQAREAH